MSNELTEQKTFMSSVVDVASNPDFDAEKLKVMFEIDKEANAQIAMEAFDNAIMNFQLEVPRIMKTAKGNNSKYAKLGTILNIIRPHMEANGLVVRFRTGRDGERTSVTCILAHKGGHRETSTWNGHIPSNKATNDAQTSGMAITYGQRYTLLPMLGIAPEDDNDAQPVPDKSTVSIEQADEIQKLLEKSGSDLISMCEFYGIGSVKDLRVTDFNDTKRKLEAKIRVAENENL